MFVNSHIHTILYKKKIVLTNIAAKLTFQCNPKVYFCGYCRIIFQAQSKRIQECLHLKKISKTL